MVLWINWLCLYPPSGSKAVEILEAYEGTLEDDYPPENERCEHGEMLLYKVSWSVSYEPAFHLSTFFSYYFPFRFPYPMLVINLILNILLMFDYLLLIINHFVNVSSRQIIYRFWLQLNSIQKELQRWECIKL